MKKLRFKSRGGILYFGVGDKFKSSKLKDTNVNRNIIIGKFKNGFLDDELELELSSKKEIPFITELLDEVMQSKSISLKHKTMLAYTVTCKNSIIPYFKDMLVTQVKPIDIKKFQDYLLSKGLKRSSIIMTRVLLKEVFNLAILNEYITLNPIVMVRIPKIRAVKKKQMPFTLDEIDLILSNTSSHIRNFLGISFFTGMRSGEVLALKWEDIDFTTDTISVNKTIAAGVVNAPKTQSSIRDIEMLDMAKEFFKAQRLETGLKDGYIFLTRKGVVYGSNTYFYGHFQKTLTKLKLDRRSLHNTRHTFASIMLNNNIDPMWVSNMLGHDNLNITLSTYAHFMPKKEKMELGFLEKRYKNGTN